MKAKTNFKVMTKPQLTEEEIQSHMDFDKLLQSYHQSGPVDKIPKWIKIFSVSIVATAVSITTYFYFQNNSLNTGESSPSQPLVTLDTASTVKQNERPQLKATTNNKKSNDSPSKKTQPPSQKSKKNDSLETEKTTVSQFTETTPVDGYPSLYAYFDRELKYPVASKDSIQGIVTVSFAITEAGKPDLIRIENSLGKAFDVECVRVIKNMPPWKPATINGKPVQVRLSIPLSFKIKK